MIEKELDAISNLSNNVSLVRILKDEEDLNITNISVAIAAAITSYGRIIMNYYRHIEGNECLYTDTDSVVLRKA